MLDAEQVSTEQDELEANLLMLLHATSLSVKQTMTAAAAACMLQVELLEHFYDALCGLVERQRLSDPLSLYVVHQVRP
jgi:hypothetical protein